MCLPANLDQVNLREVPVWQGLSYYHRVTSGEPKKNFSVPSGAKLNWAELNWTKKKKKMKNNNNNNNI